MITHPNKLAFLENFEKFGTVAATAEAIGINKFTAYDWLYSTDENDPPMYPSRSAPPYSLASIRENKEFAESLAKIKKKVQADLIARHEKNIDDVCLGEKTPAQSRIFGSLVRLRAECPERYREKTETSISAEITLISHIPIAPNEQEAAKRIMVVESPRLLKQGAASDAVESKEGKGC